MEEQEPRKRLKIDRSKEKDPIVLIVSAVVIAIMVLFLLSSVLIPGY